MLRMIVSLLCISLLVLIGYLFYPIFIVTGKPLLIVNMWNEPELPKNFRMTTDSLPHSSTYQPSQEGLKALKASGSAQFSQGGLQAILQKIPSENVTIVDLRQESHGFINGIAISWYTERDWVNKGKTSEEVIQDENQRLQQLLQSYVAIVYASKKFPVPLWVKDVKSEEELTTSHGLGYIRIPITDHLRPSNADVDTFINFIKAIPKNALWLHFHCAAGEGRTTTFLVMYDMMRNAKHVPIEDIYQRQYLLGGLNFLNEKANDWKKPYADERKDFLDQFYLYCQQNPQFQKNWTSWIAENKKKIGFSNTLKPQEIRK